MPTSDFNSAGQLNQLEHDPDNHAKRVNNYIWNGSAWVRDSGGAASGPVDLVAQDLFGNAVSGSRYNQIEIDFSSTAAVLLTELTTTATSGGSASIANGQATLTTGANTNGGYKAVTNISTEYRPMSETYAAFSTIFTAGLANSYQRIGLYNTNNGFFIGFEGTTTQTGRRGVGSEPCIWGKAIV